MAILKKVGEEIKQLDTTFCIESKCPYYYGELDECMVGEDGVPDDMEQKCVTENVELPLLENGN